MTQSHNSDLIIIFYRIPHLQAHNQNHRLIMNRMKEVETGVDIENPIHLVDTRVDTETHTMETGVYTETHMNLVVASLVILCFVILYFNK